MRINAAINGTTSEVGTAVEANFEAAGAGNDLAGYYVGLFAEARAI